MKKSNKTKGVSRDSSRLNPHDSSQQKEVTMSNIPNEMNPKFKEKFSATDTKSKEKRDAHQRKYSFEQYNMSSRQNTQLPSLPRKDEFNFSKSSRREEEFPMPDLFSVSIGKARSMPLPGASIMTLSSELRCFKIVSKGNIIHDQSIYESDSNLSTRGSQSNDGESPERPSTDLFQKFASSTHSIAPNSKGISIPNFLDS